MYTYILYLSFFIQTSAELRKYHLLGPSYILSLPYTTILQISSTFYRGGNFKFRNFESEVHI